MAAVKCQLVHLSCVHDSLPTPQLVISIPPEFPGIAGKIVLSLLFTSRAQPWSIQPLTNDIWYANLTQASRILNGYPPGPVRPTRDSCRPLLIGWEAPDQPGWGLAAHGLQIELLTGSSRPFHHASPRTLFLLQLFLFSSFFQFFGLGRFEYILNHAVIYSARSRACLAPCIPHS